MQVLFVKRVRLAVGALVVSLAATVPALAQATLPAPLAADVNQSYRLLTKTYYKTVDQQAMIAAARAALGEVAHKHHVRIPIDDVPVSADNEDTLAALDQAIANAAESAHGAPTEYAYAAITAMANSVGDKYTIFMDPDMYRSFNTALDPERISGIGVLVAPDPATNEIALTFVVPGTPADRAGLQAGDVLTTIEGTPTKNMSVENASKLLRGKAGSTVHLSVARADAAREVSVTRSEIQPPTVISKMLPENIGYIYVIAFGKDTPYQFDVALSRLRDQGARALVLDLRNDGGGYVDSALDITSHFISRHPLLTVQQRGAPDITIPADPGNPVTLPMTVLVNAYTASASEITAGALQDDGVASLVGTRTFGKGVMQTLTPLADGSAIKITTAHYLTPRKRDINLKGIDPDVVVEEPKDARPGDLAKDPQLRAAIDLLQKKIATAKP